MAASANREKGKKKFTVISDGPCKEKKCFCQSCDQDGPRLPAYGFCRDCKRFVCESCFTFHSGAIVCGKNKLFQEEYMPPTEGLSSLSIHSGQAIDLTTMGESVVGFRDPSPQCKICVASSQDKNICWITGMVTISPDRIVITDYNNRSIKMANTSNDFLTDQIRLNGKPWGVTAVTNEELAVTLPYKGKIQLVSTSSKKLWKKRTLRVSTQYWGICCCKGQLVVSLISPPELHIINMRGNILRTIGKSWCGENIFSRPQFINAKGSSIYVSDRDNKALFVLNYQGQVVSRYGTVGGPRSLTLSEDGSVFVTVSNEDENETKKVVEITGDGTERKFMLKRLNDPYAVCLCDEDNELYVSRYSERETHANFLWVFKM